MAGIGRARYGDITFRTLSGSDVVNVAPNSVVTVYQAGTTTPITDTIYSDVIGTGTYTNPFTTDAFGNITFYLTRPQRLKIKAVYTPVSGLPVTLIADNVHAAEDPITVTELVRPARYYGIKADFATDDSSHLQDAIDDAANAAVAGGHGLAKVTLDGVGVGTALLGTTLTLRKGVWLAGPGILDDNSNIDGGASAQFPLKLYWVGAVGGTMVRLKSATTGNVLTGARLTGLYLDGLQNAGFGILMQSTQYCRVDEVYVSSVRSQGIRIDDANGQIAKHNRIGVYKWAAGDPTGPCANAYGLVLEGSLMWGVTLNTIEDLSGLRANTGTGATLYLGWADNNTLLKLHSTVTGAGTTGKGVIFNTNTGTDPDPASPTYNTTVTKAASGNTLVNVMDKVTHVNHTAGQGRGNTIVCYTTEGGGIDDAGGWLNVLSIEDFSTNENYATPKYLMRDTVMFSAADLGNGGSGATRGGISGTYDQWVLHTGALDTVAGEKRIPEIGAGTFTKGRVFFTSDASVSGKNARLRLRVGSQVPGTANGTAVARSFTIDVTQTVALDNTAGKLTYFDFTFSLAHARNAILSLALTRVGTGDVLDTATTQGVLIDGVELTFSATGPDSAGSGTYVMG